MGNTQCDKLVVCLVYCKWRYIRACRDNIVTPATVACGCVRSTRRLAHARLQLASLDRLFDKLSFRAARRKETLDQQSPRSHTNAGPAKKRKRVIGHFSAERGRRIALSHSSPKSAEDARMATKWIYHACVSVTEAFVTTERVRRCYGGLVQNN